MKKQKTQFDSKDLGDLRPQGDPVLMCGWPLRGTAQMDPWSPINIPAESEESHQGTSEMLWEPLARQLICLYSWKTLRLGPSLTAA